MRVILRADNGKSVEINYEAQIARSVKSSIYDSLLFNENPCPDEDFDDYWDNVKEIRIIMEDI